jgi:hypothetical protein
MTTPNSSYYATNRFGKRLELWLTIACAVFFVVLCVAQWSIYAHGGGVTSGSSHHGGGASSGAGTSHHLAGTPTQAQCRAESEWRDADGVICLRVR